MLEFAPADDLGLFAPEEIPEPPRPPVVLALPNNLLRLQEQAGDLVTVVQRWIDHNTERRAYSYQEVRDQGPVYVWTPTVCGPKSPLLSEICQPHILSVDLRCDHSYRVDGVCLCIGDLTYRHYCTCGHVDPPRSDENGAAEDHLDHAWPGWRELPLGPTWRHEGSDSGRAKAAEKWLATAVKAGYAAEWLEAGGPVLTARGWCGGRHVCARTPWGGYDVGVYTDDQGRPMPEEIARLVYDQVNAKRGASKQG